MLSQTIEECFESHTGGNVVKQAEERQTDRQTERQTDRQRERQRERVSPIIKQTQNPKLLPKRSKMTNVIKSITYTENQLRSPFFKCVGRLNVMQTIKPIKNRFCFFFTNMIGREGGGGDRTNSFLLFSVKY